MSTKALAIRNPPDPPDLLLQDLRELIARARQDVARTVNSSLVLLYWNVGRRIRQNILKEKRAGYGEEIMQAVSAKLVQEYGNSFSEKNLRRMIQFAGLYLKEEIVVTLSRQLGWSHFIAILPLKDELQRDFYAEMCRIESWSVRTLRRKIDSKRNCMRRLFWPEADWPEIIINPSREDKPVPTTVISNDKDLPEILYRLAHLLPDVYLRKRPGTADQFEIVEERRPSKLLLINRLRGAVEEWRKAGYPGASSLG